LRAFAFALANLWAGQEPLIPLISPAEETIRHPLLGGRMQFHKSVMREIDAFTFFDRTLF
jgi:hypothetical protein